MKRNDIVTKEWSEYALIDSGKGRKLERFAHTILDRPDPQALWDKSTPTLWGDAQAQFIWADKGERWKVTKGISESWHIMWHDIVLNLSFKEFKHIGIFPEHAYQWEEIQSIGKKNNGLRMLNLFGYTGALSIAAAQVGIHVTHVDASKSTIDIVKENTKQSGLSPDAIRVICEDATRYTKRLIKRKETFEIIVMDPPAFGRGPKGEVWKIEESLGELIALLPSILSKNAKLVLLNGYASGYSARTLAELLRDVLPSEEISYGDIGIQQRGFDRTLTTGIYAEWKRI